METFRWTNPGQPQTLQISVMLAYFRAFFLLISGSAYYQLLPLDIAGSTIARLTPWVLLIAFVAGGLGIASERKWGYLVCRIAAIYAVVAVIWFMIRFNVLMDLGVLLRLMFDAALVVTLLHDQSRDYAKIWFR